MEEGFGFLDTTQLQSGTVGTPFLITIEPHSFVSGEQSHRRQSGHHQLQSASFSSESCAIFSVAETLSQSQRPQGKPGHRCLRFGVTVDAVYSGGL